MSRTDPDLEVMRATAVDIAGRGADPDPAAVARVWSRVAMPSESAPIGRRLRWVALPAGAAVAAVLLASVLLRPSPVPSVHVGAPASSSIQQPSATISPSMEPSVRVTDPGIAGDEVSTAQVIDELVAASASVPPVALADGQLLYLRIETAGVTSDGTVTMGLNEQWLHPDGLRVMNIILNGQDQSWPSGRDGTTYSPPPPGPPSLTEPNPQWLAELTTDPVELYDMFAALNTGIENPGSSYVLKELSYFMMRCDPLLPPALRAALFRVLGEIGGVMVTELDVDGWRLYRVRQHEDPIDLLIDPATGRAVGQRWSDGSTGTESIELYYFTVVDEVGQTG